MIKNFILLIFFQIFLFSQYILMSDYIFQNSTITGKDIFPEIEQDIFIYKVSNKKNSFSINANDIVNRFKKYGIEVKKQKIKRVKFIRVSSDVCLDCLSGYITDEFQNSYSFLDIEEVFIYPKRSITNFPDDYTVVFKSSNLKKSEGYFYIEERNRRKIHFKFVIKAFLNVIKSSERIKKGSVIDEDNIYYETVKFKRLLNGYITENQLGSIIAKSYIPKDRELIDRMVKKIDVINRNQFVKGFINDGSIYIEIEVKALQSGGIDDVIQIETPEGSKLRAKIISSKLVEIQ